MSDVTDNDPAVQVTDVWHAYGERPALRGVGFAVRRGEIFGLLGPNGGGKSTLFRILSTLLVPQRGSARILGLDVQADRSRVRRALGVVFQSPALDRQLSVRENLRYQGHLYGLHGGVLQKRSQELLQRLGLSDRGDARVATLSGGLRRRVELAKCLLHQPQVLILDEPSTGLDPGARLEFWHLLEEVRRERGVTILLTSHILEEAERCDRVAILERGHLVTSGAPLELKAAVGEDVVTVAARDPARLAAGIAAQFGLAPRVVDTSVRLEHGASAALLPRLVETFPDDILSLTLSKPTFEDVFIHFTGHRFDDAGESGSDGSAAGAGAAGRRGSRRH
ncbi:MAG TPA: ABC transporter ATP-binding protein [Candidatus Krumholzibacteria bacterium]|nr:ABC transporter ATP-binding protein [Candidatus Krumholzibacteria bacterium]